MVVLSTEDARTAAWMAGTVALSPADRDAPDPANVLRDSPWAFSILCGFLVTLAAAQYRLVKKLRWLPKQEFRLKRRRPR